MLAAFLWPRGCSVETAVSSCRDADFDIAQLLASVWGLAPFVAPKVRAWAWMGLVLQSFRSTLPILAYCPRGQVPTLA